MIVAGVDAGSRTIKAVLFDPVAQRVVASGTADQGLDQPARVRRLFEEVLRGAGLDRSSVAVVLATGYGRDRVDFADSTLTEITCHAVGVRFLIPEARSVVDIGGQDTKWIALDSAGRVRDFAMNDRCAAGTGRFLEVVCERLEIPLADLGAMAARSLSPAAINSTCMVFAETEIVGLLAQGAAREDVLAGVRTAIVSRVATLAGRRLAPPVVFTGGVALVPGMVEALATALKTKVLTPPTPLLTGALGAAILASRSTA